MIGPARRFLFISDDAFLAQDGAKRDALQSPGGHQGAGRRGAQGGSRGGGWSRWRRKGSKCTFWEF